MATRDFWRGYREHYGEDRDRDPWSSGAGRHYGEGNWSPGSQYYADYYGGRDYSQPYGYGERRWGYGDYPRDEDRRYGIEYGTGQYRGRGPRGYQRSDERIREDVCDRLTDDASIDASNLEVTVKNGEVTLSGTVNSRDEKRRAEECAEDISGVKDVHNTLRVSTEPPIGEQRAGEPMARH